MSQIPDLTNIGSLIADASRCSIILTLLSGQSLPATELAMKANVTPQTASSHLSKLVKGGLIQVKKMGRHRYYRIANCTIAGTLEQLIAISPTRGVENEHEFEPIKLARTCYDHLAGKLGVGITKSLVEDKYIILEDDRYILTKRGITWLKGWQIEEQNIRNKRRKFAYPCIDWSERRFHLAGALGAEIANLFLENQWVVRISGTRAIEITKIGRNYLLKEFGISPM